MRYELWHEDGTYTLLAEGPGGRELLEDNASLVRVFEADTWEDAMAQYHVHMGWHPYKPLAE